LICIVMFSELPKAAYERPAAERGNKMEVLTKKILEDAIEKALNQNPVICYSSVCFQCGKSFLSYKPMNNFTDCEQHKHNDDYKMIKPLKC